MEQDQERFAVVGDKVGGGSFTAFITGREEANRQARWYRGRGFKVMTYPAARYVALIEAQEPGTFTLFPAIQ